MSDVFNISSAWQRSVDLSNLEPIPARIGTWAYAANPAGVIGIPGVKYNTSGAINDWMAYYVDLAKGVWQLSVIGVAFSSGGIVEIKITFDNTTWITIGTIDLYQTGGGAQKRVLLSSFVVPKSGVAEVSFQAISKNASSAGYYLELYKADFGRMS